MSQHDLVIADQGTPAFRADLNSALQALGSTSKGSSAPATPYTGQLWLDDAATPWVLKLYDGSSWIPFASINASTNVGRAALPRNYIAGLKLSNSGDADHDIDIAVGEARAADDSDDLALAASLTKQIDAAWSVGTNAGGLDSGSVANSTLYAVWLIKRSDTGVVDALFSTSFSAPTMPASYDKKRLIGAVKTNGSANIIAFLQSGDYFRFLGALPIDVSDATITAQTFETGTLSVPPLCLAHVYAAAQNTSSTDVEGSIWLRTKGAADAASFGEDFANFAAGGITFDNIAAIGPVLVDASSQIEYAAREASATTTVTIRTIGFEMITRRDP